MKRRNLILGLLASGVGMTHVLAQTAAKKLARIVAIVNGDEAGFRPFKESLVTGMHALGQIEGRTYRLEFMYANREPLRAVGLIADAVASRPDILLVAGLTNAKRARDATTTIPVVVATSSNLVDAGVIASFARPGGNVTGITDLADELAEKRLELLVELHPRAKRVALLNNPDFPAAAKIETRVVAAAGRFGVTVLPIYARDRASLSLAVESLRNPRPDALLIGGDGLFVVNAESLIQECWRARGAGRSLLAGHRRDGRASEPSGGHSEELRTGRLLLGPHPQRRQAGRSAGRATGAVRAGGQSQGCACVRHLDRAIDRVACGQDHRLIRSQ